MVKELRERTGAGMMECKKALVETNGDLEAAAEHLRKTGLAKADKKASRVAAEGKLAMASSEDGNEVVMVEINCETDFVAKDANFLAFTEAVAANALNAGTTEVETLNETELNGGTVELARQALVAKIGENIQIRRINRLQSDNTIGAYVHGGRIGAMVEIEGGDEELAHDIAMHVAALNPEFIDVDDVPAEVLEKEKQFLIAQAADSGKPADIIEKMVSGRMRKHISSITLLGQDFVKDSDVTVAQLLKKNNASVRSMTRIAVGEGIEKKQENFADEVMQQVKGA
jgi:elongation factor Ts